MNIAEFTGRERVIREFFSAIYCVLPSIYNILTYRIDKSEDSGIP